MPRPMFKNENTTLRRPLPVAAPRSVPMSEATPLRLPVARLSHRRPTVLQLDLAPADCAALAADLGLLALGPCKLAGEIRPRGRDDFVLEARLQARAVQPCVVTLAPVPVWIDEPLTRTYLTDYAEPEGEEVEVPQDDSMEPLPEVLDLLALLAEALALALPLYPRAPGAELGESVFAAKGVTPLADNDLRPFAALARLTAKPQDPGAD